MSAPRVSIGVPVYNGERLLAGALDSLLGQSFGDVEVIVSDNASTDGTEALCRAYAARDPRVRYVRQPRNLGPLANFHYVLHEARADYFMWAAYDDLREPTFVEKLAAALDGAPRAVLASCQFDVIVEPGARAPAMGHDWRRFFAQPRARQIAGMITLDEYDSQKAVHIYGLARREPLRRATAAVASVHAYSGWDICTLVHLLCQGEVVIVPEALLHYRLNAPAPAPAPPFAPEAAAEAPRSRLGAEARRAARVLRHPRYYATGYLRPNAEYFAGIRLALRGHPTLPAPTRLGLTALAWARQTLRAGQLVRGALRRDPASPMGTTADGGVR